MEISIVIVGFNNVKNLFNSKILDEFIIKYYSFKYLLLKNPFITPSFMFKNDIEIKFSEYDGGFEDHYFLMKISNRYGQIPSLQLPLASIYKNIYGESGLTSKMWYMQKGYFFIYKELYKSSTITYISYLFLTFYSMIKYIRRLLKVYI